MERLAERVYNKQTGKKSRDPPEKIVETHQRE